MLLDTNAVIGILAKDADLLHFLRQFRSLLIPSMALGELYFGAYKSQRQENNLLAIEDFYAAGPWCCLATRKLPVTTALSATSYAALAGPIPVNDVWIAAVRGKRAYPSSRATRTSTWCPASRAGRGSFGAHLPIFSLCMATKLTVLSNGSLRVEGEDFELVDARASPMAWVGGSASASAAAG